MNEYCFIIWIFIQFVLFNYMIISLLIPNPFSSGKSIIYVLSPANLLKIQTGPSPFGWQPHCDIPDDWFSEYSNIPNYSRLWPEGRVTYEFHPNLTQANKENISNSFEEFHKNTCIRFEPRHDATKQTAYLSIEPDNTVKCALSSFCYKNTYQFMRISPTCFTPAVLIHQLGHSLCLPHEHQRSDRDDYVDFTQCTALGKEVPQKLNFNRFLTYPYDYLSQMHNQCDKCNGGLPKSEQVYSCGVDMRNELSTLDVDKINELYNCQGCFRHRWISTKNLKKSDKQAMIPFGYSHHANQSTYLCRASVGGEIIPGTYRLDEDLCYVTLLFEVVKVRKQVQVFTLPPPKDTVEAIKFKQTNYRMIPFHAMSSDDRLIPVGQTVFGTTSYAAVASLLGEDSMEKLIGIAYGNFGSAQFPFQNRTEIMEDYNMLVCSSSRTENIVS